uniref:Bacteriophage CI repressor N-terminal domain-containing protein n=1 Tax=Arsenophonus endosymbiont of Trialeurodes vaporariorum TaxID=235567 RepID=A0A3B0M3L9_9GAMM
MMFINTRKISESPLVRRLTELNDRGMYKSEMAKIAGVSRQAVNVWFVKGNINRNSAISIAEAAGVSLEWLYGEEVDERQGLRQNEKELLDIFNQLPLNEQETMIFAFKLRLKELDKFVEEYIKRRSKDESNRLTDSK